MYENILAPNLARQKSTSFKTGLALGLNQLIMYSVLAGFFWIGAEIVVYYEGDISPASVMSAIMILMLGTMNAGASASSAPDMGRANASVDKVYGVLDHQSTIDAVADDNNKEKVRLDLSKIKGQIEFEDVWFRYPTRKEDFVLRGLNLKINPSESCALVGESGCGKSTFINLVMRFYDPAHGRILLDG
jgi:ATP-binding cassette subfamily B (MDR/TAP) protein 1